MNDKFFIDDRRRYDHRHRRYGFHRHRRCCDCCCRRHCSRHRVCCRHCSRHRCCDCCRRCNRHFCTCRNLCLRLNCCVHRCGWHQRQIDAMMCDRCRTGAYHWRCDEHRCCRDCGCCGYCHQRERILLQSHVRRSCCWSPVCRVNRRHENCYCQSV